MKKQKKYENVSIPQLVAEGGTAVYLFLMTGIFPVFYPGTLLYLHAAKTNFFTAATVVYLCSLFFPCAFQIGKSIASRQKIKLSGADLFGGVYFGAIVISIFLALDQTKVLFGNSKARMGAILILLHIAAFFAVKQYGRRSAALIWTNLFASTFIHLSGILLTCKIDPLQMQNGIVEEQKEIFISPLGNINYNVAYMGIMISAAMAMFLLSRELFAKRALGAYLYIGFMDVICLRAEAAVVMFAVVALLLLYFALEQRRYLLQYIGLFWIFFAASVSVSLLKGLLQEHMYDFTGLNALLIKPQTLLLEGAAALILLFLYKRKEALAEQRLQRAKKVYARSLLALTGIVVVAALLRNLFWADQSFGNGLDALLLKDATGSNRGYIWKRTLEVFARQPLFRQLFGAGPACFYDLISPLYGEEMMALFSAVFYDPHNDFLWVLSTTGILGAVGFFGLTAYTIVRAVKKRKTQEMQLVTIVALAAFLTQGLVNSFTIFSLPFAFLMMALSYTSSKKTKA